MLALFLVGYSVSASFESGALRHYEWPAPDHLVAYVRGQADEAGRNYQPSWFYFSVSGPKGRTLTVDIAGLEGSFTAECASIATATISTATGTSPTQRRCPRSPPSRRQSIEGRPLDFFLTLHNTESSDYIQGSRTVRQIAERLNRSLQASEHFHAPNGPREYPAEPVDKAGNSVARHAFTGWQLSGITTLISGAPLGVSMATTDNADIGGGGDGVRPVMLANPVLPKSDRTFEQFFNTQGVRPSGAGRLRQHAKGRVPRSGHQQLRHLALQECATWRGPAGDAVFDGRLTTPSTTRSSPLSTRRRDLTLRAARSIRASVR